MDGSTLWNNGVVTIHKKKIEDKIEENVNDSKDFFFCNSVTMKKSFIFLKLIKLIF